MRVPVCVCVCACVRACVRACVCVCVRACVPTLRIGSTDKSFRFVILELLLLLEDHKDVRLVVCGQTILQYAQLTMSKVCNLN